ncbi:Rab21a [Monocercomonoides exilis]|uniref:Rab21a n=1 Tax=Monocercomonoides exilis TaxID=2049356 RepID=UPI003559ED81|nr:Rab21a [Monocercomonoides exilis]|eukprot:MONOS_4063.1-p1 / transcript=MONOS_4063.1 / gene=MONOS_4063 / organism=Monocercomonoides_exilis_PA203 / gene_product=Rab21a / transcript_product=Rab21a / location=Mono_scaffold00103:59825-60931(-) / protein_length=199 / sequence_SO=supercontig / SO=protein_coding / is_pseudo=false
MAYRVVFLGEGRVGKTSLIMKYVKNVFTEKQESTTEAQNFEQRVKVDDSFVPLDIWDTAGQERYHSLGPIYYREAKGAILVYDITDIDSFVKVKKWVKELHAMVGTNIAIAICGNKIDREREKVVDLSEAEAYAASVGATHFTTSAKTGKGVQEAFTYVAREIKKRDKTGRNFSAGSGTGLKVGTRDEPKPSGSGCPC